MKNQETMITCIIAAFMMMSEVRGSVGDIGPKPSKNGLIGGNIGPIGPEIAKYRARPQRQRGMSATTSVGHDSKGCRTIGHRARPITTTHDTRSTPKPIVESTWTVPKSPNPRTRASRLPGALGLPPGCPKIRG
jgi:hypothetical protein